MSFTMILRSLPKIRHFSTAKRNITGSKVILNKAPKASPSPSISNVTGVSEKVVKIPKDPVGPGASKSTNYQNPEYFCYDKTSYFEAEVEMLKYRCPQPSVFKFYEHSNPK